MEMYWMTETKLRELFSKMTPEEKVGQLVQLDGSFFQDSSLATGPRESLGLSQKMVDCAGSVLNIAGAARIRRLQSSYLKRSRLGIPLLVLCDVIYGYRTVYPIPIALGCAWDPDLARESCALTAEEAAAGGVGGTYAPMADLVRDARWGRCRESTGEDPLLNSRYASAMVEGFQQGLGGETGQGIAACVKHFAGYGAVEAGREYNTVDMSERRLRGAYLPSYHAAVKAGCRLVMTSFNTVDGIPSTGNRHLVKDILRGEWGFSGVVISDYASIREMKTHGVAENDRDAAELAMNAGVDIDMMTGCYANELLPLVGEGRISSRQIDEACLRVLRLKNDLGLFEDPFRGFSEADENTHTFTPAMLSQSRKAALESSVLLKNRGGVLPLRPGTKVSLIGPYADMRSLLDAWAMKGDSEHWATLHEAMAEALGPDFVGCAPGSELLDPPQGSPQKADKMIADAKRLASGSDLVVLALGEDTSQSGEASSRTELTLPACQTRLLDAVSACGKPVVLVLFNGRPLVLTDVVPKVDALLEAWFPGTEGSRALCDLLTGHANPSGRLSMSFPRAVGQEPLYYNHFNTGRPFTPGKRGAVKYVSKYIDCPNEPLFPFGFGLSYHTAEYGELTLSGETLKPGGSLSAHVTVKNTGTVPGTETVQLYLRDLVGSVVRPVLELKDFQKLALAPGEAKTAEFTITEPMLRFYTRSMKFESEAGRFAVFAGPNSVELRRAEFTFVK